MELEGVGDHGTPLCTYDPGRRVGGGGQTTLRMPRIDKASTPGKVWVGDTPFPNKTVSLAKIHYTSWPMDRSWG